MSELMNIEKVSVGAKKLTARVRMNPGMPLRTSEDIEGTARAYYLAPAIAKHACLGDAGKEFQDCMGDTEVAHLLEHLAVEIMIETGLGGDIASGRTRAVPDEDRAYEVELSCPDDALTLGALSSAAFMLDWAFLHADQPAPDFAGTVEDLKRLVLGLRTDDAEASEGDAGKEAAPGADDAGGADGEGQPAADSAGEEAAPAAVDGLVSAARSAIENVPGASAPDAPAAPIDTEGAQVTEAELGANVLFGGAAVDGVPESAPGAEGQEPASSGTPSDADSTVTMRPLEN